jgi:DNA segregation ATPase FtsK/SpoIIIE, S-DNA-T family
MASFPWTPFLGLVVILIAVMTVIARAGSRTNFTISDWIDPLSYPVPPFPPTDDLLRIPVAVNEDWRPVTLPLLGNHLLIAGVTGSGKGSVIWSLVAGCQPARRQGLVEIRAVDPKGGMELMPGFELFDVLVDNPDDGVDILEQAVTDMDDRAHALADVGIRKLLPGDPDQEQTMGVRVPLVVVLIDELADLLDSPDRELRKRCHQALQALLRKGRAVGFCVIGATQDARVEVIGMRALFRQRIALRTADANQADMILGMGAREAGAETHRIPRAHPGIGYLLTEGGHPRRIRFAYLTDDHIAQLCEEATA